LNTNFRNIIIWIRFRVKDELFHDTTPTGPPKTNNQIATTSTIPIREEEKKSPYSIIASIDEPGLGLLSWWNQ
jgi:DNA-directed RNA polymerase III subunit RPC8